MTNAIEEAKAELAREMRLLTSLCAMFDAAIGHSEPADRQTIRVQEIRELGIRASRTLAALSGEGETAPEPIEDLWFTDSRLPIMAMSADENPCVLKVFFRRPVTRQDRDDMIAAQNAFLRAQSPTPVSGLTEEERAEGLGLAHQTPMQDVEIEYWLNQADNYAEVSMPCDDLRSLIARALSPAPGIDWERVGEIRARHEAADNGDMEGEEWDTFSAFEEAHDDRAFLLSLLPKEKANDGQ